MAHNNNPFISSQQMQNQQQYLQLQLMMQWNQMNIGQNAVQMNNNLNQNNPRHSGPNLRNTRNTRPFNDGIDDEENVKKQVVVYNLSEPSNNVNGSSVDAITVSEILKAIGVSPNINLIKRMGRFITPSNPRPIVARFNLERDQNDAVKNAYKLDEYPGWKHIWIRPYLPRGERITKQNRSNQNSLQPSNKSKQPQAISINPFVNFASHSSEDSKSINILVIGASGVGKSTWINGIANYMNFGTLDDALNAEQPVCMIPMKYEMPLEKDFPVDMKQTVGEKNEELFAPGQSCTQQPKVYRYVTKKFDFNLIDTPGICDTRGVEVDTENMKMIVECMAQWEEIHGICLLLKPNENRSKLLIRYCLQELLSNLHKSTIPNISVVFTNTSTTFFRPGGTMTLLKTLADEVKIANQSNLSLNDQNTFCIENESVKILYAHHKGADINEDLIENSSSSWEHTVNETYRMFKYFTELVPHLVDETKATSHVRRILTELATIMADINNEITQEKKKYDQQTNQLKALETKMNEMQSPNYKGECLEKTPLSYPVTVCCGSNCIEIISNERFHKKICCSSCHLTSGVAPEHSGHPQLRSCTAFGDDANCKICGCSWQLHQHIRYSQKKATKEFSNAIIQQEICQIKLQIGAKPKYIQQIQTTIVNLEKNYKIVQELCQPYLKFLSQNSIIVFNSAFEDYLTMEMDMLEQKTKVGGDRSKIEYLQKVFAIHQELKSLKDIPTSNSTQFKIDMSNYHEKIKNLENHDIVGPKLKNSGSYQRLFNAMDYKLVRCTTKVKTTEHPKKPLNTGKFKQKNKKIHNI